MIWGGKVTTFTHLFFFMLGYKSVEHIFTITKELVMANQVHPVGISDACRAGSSFVMAWNTHLSRVTTLTTRGLASLSGALRHRMPISWIPFFFPSRLCQLGAHLFIHAAFSAFREPFCRWASVLPVTPTYHRLPMVFWCLATSRGFLWSSCFSLSFSHLGLSMQWKWLERHSTSTQTVTLK